MWWRYEIALEGKLTLRCPETASGRRVPMTGELTGCATGFKSWDDALRVGWPKLMAGALIYRTAKEPFGGTGTCAPFDVPVKAELEGDAITLTIEPTARKDYGEPTVHVRYLVISPLAGGFPAQTSFTLPYKSAHFVLTRALDEKPIKLPIRRQGRQMHIATELKATRGRGGARGNYSLGIRACNPGCSK